MYVDIYLHNEKQIRINRVTRAQLWFLSVLGSQNLTD